MDTRDYDIIIVGAGPVGLAAAIAAKKKGLKVRILEKGVLCNSIFNYPYHMRFFTTADLLEIGNYAFPSTDVKPTRQRALDYYRRVTQLENLDVVQHCAVHEILGEEGSFTIKATMSRRGESKELEFGAKYVVVATGYFDNPVGLGEIPGEELEHVSTYYTQPHGYFDHDVVIIGAGNSGAEAALELHRHGARVTLIHKYPEPKETLKYWVGPDLKNRIAEGSIKSVMPANTLEIVPSGLYVETPMEERMFIAADQIFVLTGFTPNTELLSKFGMNIRDDLSVELSDRFESNRKGVYVVGSAGFGRKTNSVFIENGRDHAAVAIHDIYAKMKK